MGLSILHIVEAVLLSGNAMAILNEKRFLRKCMRFSILSLFIQIHSTNLRLNQDLKISSQLSYSLLGAICRVRVGNAPLSHVLVPLIIANIIVIFLEVLIG